MSDTLQPSPMIAAGDLIRVNVDAMQLDDLIDHERHALETLAGLNDFINQPGRKGADELRNAMRLAGKVMQHMAHLRDLIHARKAAMALVHATQAAGSASTVQTVLPSCE